MAENDMLKQAEVKAPPTLYYFPDFISADEESYLWKHVYDAPKPKWTQLSNRRLQNWGGLPHPKGMVPEDIPQWLEIYTKKIASLGVYGDKVPNHVLVNEYLPGQGIMPHEDGPLFYPTVSTISLGSHTLLDFYRPMPGSDSTNPMDSSQESSTSFEDRYMCSVLLQPRSLILVRDDMYKINLHGIAEHKEDVLSDSVVNLCKCKDVKVGDKLERTTRVSLTIRYVPKVLKAKLLLGNKR